MKRFFINFFILSTIGLLFFRPLFFKKEIKIENINQIDSVYYYHGFPISSLVKDKPGGTKTKASNYKLIIEPVKVGIWIGGIESDVEIINLKNYNLPEGWKKDEYGWINYYDENKPNKLEFNIKAKNFIKILVGHGQYNGAFIVKIDTIERYIEPYSDNGFVKWHSVYLDRHILISPESKEAILKVSDIKNFNIKGYDYELLDNDKILIKNLKVDYFKVFLNSLLVIIYTFILSIVLTFSNSLFLRYFSIVFTILFIYFLAYFPGLYFCDPVDQVLQAIKVYPCEDWQTPFHTLTFLIVLKLFNHIGFYILIQIIFASILFAWILSKLKLKNLELYLILIFAFPLTGLVLNNAWKDTYFSLSLIWLSFLLYFAYNDKNYLKNNLNLIAFIISLSFVMLFRYNGIPIVIITLIIMLFLFKEQFKKVLLITLIILGIYFISNFLFYKLLKFSKTAFKYQKDFLVISEYVINNFPFSNEEKRIIEEFLSFEHIKQKYVCESTVPLFWAQEEKLPKLKQNGPKIRKILIRAISKDIRPFINHTICSSLYLWYPFKKSFFMGYTYEEYICGKEVYIVGLERNMKIPQIREIIQIITDWLLKLTPILFNISIYNWFIFLVFLLIPKFRFLILLGLLNIIILIILTPSDHFRFGIPSYLLSLILLLIFINHLRNKNSNLKYNNKW
ncbi:MAG: hypothetical protein ABIL61_02940 [candidate division WOR-3 bacterium]